MNNKLALFYGNSLGTQILVSQIAKGLKDEGYSLSLFRSKRNRNAYPQNILQAEYYFYVYEALEDIIFPYLDERPKATGAMAFSPTQLDRILGIPHRVLTSKEVSSAKFIEYLRQQSFDGAISVRFPYFFNSQLISAICTQKHSFFWNLHSASLPDYAGYTPLMWMLYDRMDTASFTLHEVAETFDSGAIIGHWPQPLNLETDYYTNLLNLIPKAVEMTVQTVRLVSHSQGVPLKTYPNCKTPKSKFYPKPNAEDYDKLRSMGVELMSKDSIKKTYLDYFSVYGTDHWKGLKALIDQFS